MNFSISPLSSQQGVLKQSGKDSTGEVTESFISYLGNKQREGQERETML